MGSFIILEDGRAWAVGDGAFDDALEAIASQLPASAEGKSLAIWLVEQKTGDRGMGLGRVDLRELTPPNRELFKSAAQRFYPQAIVNVGDYNPAWLELFAVLLKLIKLADKREDPRLYNPHMDALCPPTGAKVGPGWQ